VSKAQWIAANLKPGEEYAGLVLGKDGAPDHHLILLPGEAAEVTWQQAKDWSLKAGGELPTRREQSLLFANRGEDFKPSWYWSSESYRDDGWAWCQYFYDGYQYDGHKLGQLRARAVRRLPI